MGKLVNMFSETNKEEIITSLQKQGHYDYEIDGEKISLDKDDFVIDFDAKEEFAVSKRDNYIVFISTSRNKEMMARGLVKDIARRLQTLRKERGYNPTDILNVASILDLDEESLEMIKEKSEDLAFLVIVKKVDFVPNRFHVQYSSHKQTSDFPFFVVFHSYFVSLISKWKGVSCYIILNGTDCAAIP